MMKGVLLMRGKFLKVITTFILSGALICCSQQEQTADKQNALQEKALSSISETSQPDTSSKPSALKEFAQEITTDFNIKKMSSNKVVEILLNVKNISTETWPLTKSDNSVSLGYYWMEYSKEKPMEGGGRIFLPYDLSPGQSIKLNAIVKAPANPGKYILRFSMVQEKVAWFNDRGAKTLDIAITVTE